MKILFYDGILEELFWNREKWLREKFPFGVIVNAAYGPKENLEGLVNLYERHKLNPNVCVFTKSPVALSHVYGWNKEEGHTDIYLWREKYNGFIRCDKLTLKEIREAHNIEKMYLSGSFEEEIPELPEYLKGI